MLNLYPKETVISRTFSRDGALPNSVLPAVIFKKAVSFGSFAERESEQELKSLADKNEWWLDWTDKVYSWTHYHSTAHEALVVFRGEATLKLGGENIGSDYQVKSGDVVLIPAGLGHQAVSYTGDFTVFGLYPKDQKWDLRRPWKRNFNGSVDRIKKVSLPVADLLFGKYGPLMDYWK